MADLPDMNGWRCCGCGVLAPNRVKHCDCITNVCSRDGATEWMMSRRQAAARDLSNVIKAKLINVEPQDQDAVLEPHDWALIITALEAFNG